MIERQTEVGPWENRGFFVKTGGEATKSVRSVARR
jgi:hypothetical protein